MSTTPAPSPRVAFLEDQTYRPSFVPSIGGFTARAQKGQLTQIDVEEYFTSLLGSKTRFASFDYIPRLASLFNALPVRKLKGADISTLDEQCKTASPEVKKNWKVVKKHISDLAKVVVGAATTKAGPCRFFYYPVLNNNSHFSLFAVDLCKNKLFALDSNIRATPAAKDDCSAIRWMYKVAYASFGDSLPKNLVKKSNSDSISLNLQNDIDSGVFICLYAALLQNGKSLPEMSRLDKEDVTYFRNHLVSLQASANKKKESKRKEPSATAPSTPNTSSKRQRIPKQQQQQQMNLLEDIQQEELQRLKEQLEQQKVHLNRMYEEVRKDQEEKQLELHKQQKQLEQDKARLMETYEQFKREAEEKHRQEQMELQRQRNQLEQERAQLMRMYEQLKREQEVLVKQEPKQKFPFHHFWSGGTRMDAKQKQK